MSFVSLTDEHQPFSTELFLDTSIHCSWQKGDSFRRRINGLFRRFAWKSASSYSKVEYGNNILSHAEYFLKKLAEFDSIERTLEFISHVLPNIGANIGHKQWAFSLLLTWDSATEAEKTERARLSLQRLMKLGVRFVDSLCDNPIQDGTQCYWAAAGVKKRRNGLLEWKTPDCKSTLKRCRVDEFFVENKELFLKIRDTVNLLPQERKTAQLEGFVKVIDAAIEDSSTLLNYKSGCKSLADAIIAIESKSFRSMFSQNTRESSVLCELLDQVFYYLPPQDEKGILYQLSPTLIAESQAI